MTMNKLELAASLNRFVEQKIKSSVQQPHTGVVVSYSAGVDLVVRLSDIPEEEILLTFAEGSLLVLDGHTLAADDQVILLPVNQKYLVLELSSTI